MELGATYCQAVLPCPTLCSVTHTGPTSPGSYSPSTATQTPSCCLHEFSLPVTHG